MLLTLYGRALLVKLALVLATGLLGLLHAARLHMPAAARLVSLPGGALRRLRVDFERLSRTIRWEAGGALAGWR